MNRQQHLVFVRALEQVPSGPGAHDGEVIRTLLSLLTSTTLMKPDFPPAEVGVPNSLGNGLPGRSSRRSIPLHHDKDLETMPVVIPDLAPA